MLMCQDMPRLPNKSVLGKYFIAQSCTTSTDDSSNDSRILILAASWFKERSMWAFQAIGRNIGQDGGRACAFRPQWRPKNIRNCKEICKISLQWHTRVPITHKTNYTRLSARPHAMHIRFDEPGCYVIYIHKKSSHCETLKSNRMKKKHKVP